MKMKMVTGLLASATRSAGGIHVLLKSKNIVLCESLRRLMLGSMAAGPESAKPLGTPLHVFKTSMLRGMGSEYARAMKTTINQAIAPNLLSVYRESRGDSALTCAVY